MSGLARTPGSPINPGAIHRCVLAGFPSQIGCRGEEREYRGPRGVGFLIAPGSSLHRQEAPWVVAAELVETSRLYARSVGRVRADWVERVAPHLVSREIFEPHWMPEAGQVAAWERVSLHGLTLVQKRRVPFGPIDPRAARDIFIQAALVDETIRTDGDFLGHNRELIEQLERAEAKKRAQDLLVDLRARFDFYDARIPPEIHSTPSFEKWRRQAERGNPRLLHMTREVLLRPGASGLAPEDYPDSLAFDELRLPLDYLHQPGDPEDGVTLTLPLAAIEQVPAQRVEWLVPGMLVEKVIALLRTLPKRQRVRFVPAAEYAEGAVEAMPFGEGSLTVRLAAHLHRLTGMPVAASDFRLEEIPVHLRMNIHVVDEGGAVVARGRDLASLQRELGGRARASLSEAAGLGAGASGATGATGATGAWGATGALGTSGDARASEAPGTLDAPEPPALPARMTSFPTVAIPEVVSVMRAGIALRAFPGMLDLGDAVTMRLFGRKDVARAAHAQGLCRLLAIALREEIEPMLDYLPHGAGGATRAGGPRGLLAGQGGAAPMGIDDLAILHAPYGPRSSLVQDLELRIAERAAGLAGVGLEEVRNGAAFADALARARTRVWDAGCQAMDLVGRILQGRLELDRVLDAPLPSTWEEAVADVRRQLEDLLPIRFLARTPWEWLVHMPRYLRAAAVRLHKLRDGGHRRDAEQVAVLRPFLDRFEARLAALSAPDTDSGPPATRGVVPASSRAPVPAAASARSATSPQADAATPGLARFRWLLEEFRVSLFAQDLRTAVPISAARLEREWNRVEA